MFVFDKTPSITQKLFEFKIEDLEILLAIFFCFSLLANTT